MDRHRQRRHDLDRLEAQRPPVAAAAPVAVDVRDLLGKRPVPREGLDELADAADDARVAQGAEAQELVRAPGRAGPLHELPFGKGGDGDELVGKPREMSMTEVWERALKLGNRVRHR